MLGEELGRARLAAGLTQEELSLRANVDRSYISQLERGLKSPTLDTLFLLSDAIGCAASDLVARVEAGRPRRPGPGAPDGRGG